MKAAVHVQEVSKPFSKDLTEKGELKAVMDRRYPLDRIVEAYESVQTGQKVGNVGIPVGPTSSVLTFA